MQCIIIWGKNFQNFVQGVNRFHGRMAANRQKDANAIKIFRKLCHFQAFSAVMLSKVINIRSTVLQMRWYVNTNVYNLFRMSLSLYQVLVG